MKRLWHIASWVVFVFFKLCYWVFIVSALTHCALSYMAGEEVSITYLTSVMVFMLFEHISPARSPSYLYTYFVSFSHNNGGCNSRGNCIVQLKRKVADASDIQRATVALVKKRHPEVDGVIVTSFQELR